MTLAELNTPLERKRMIEYGSDGNKVVRRWHNVRHAIGNLWVTEPWTDEWKNEWCTVFLVLSGGDGLKVDHGTRASNDVDYLMRAYDYSLDNLYGLLDARANADGFIGNAHIAFVRQFDPARAAVYDESRAKFYARKEEQEREQREQKQREAEEKAARKKAEDEAARAVYGGWADNMTAMQFGRADKVLSKMIRCDGIVSTKREWVERKLKEGWKPDKEEDVVSYYGSRWDPKQSQPKTEYRLVMDRLCYTISKTEWDYASFLLNQKCA